MKRQEFLMPMAVHSDIDDANLSAEEFRVLAHICRRCGSGKNGRQCDSSIPSMAKICRLHPDTVRKAIASLVELNWVSLIERPGQTKVHVAHFPKASILKKDLCSDGKGQDLGKGYNIEGEHPSGSKVELPSDFKGGHPSDFRVAEGIRSRDPDKVQSVDSLALPFQSNEFKNAWNDWKQHRIEKKKPITPLSAKKSLQQLSSMGEARAIAAINHSIANGWQGIFEQISSSVTSPPTQGVVIIGGRTFK